MVLQFEGSRSFLRCTDELLVMAVMGLVLTSVLHLPFCSNALLAWGDHSCHPGSAESKQLFCSGIPKVLESPKKESNRVKYKGEKVGISLKFSYFPVVFVTFFNF